jgi:hypothetical protein
MKIRGSPHFRLWHIAIFGGTAEIGRNRANADFASGSAAKSPVAIDPGCVKTLTFNLRVEYPSRFRPCGNQMHWQLLSEEGN